MKILKAYPLLDGTYWLDGNTYPLKEEIKRHGGIWDGSHWKVDMATVHHLGAQKMTWVKHEPHCCNKNEGFAWALPSDIVRMRVPVACSMCDESYRDGRTAKIIECMPPPY